ncbi:MAG: O-antigen ligase family protein [Verrucomicrobia bacterium]|nr:O-antigen ligase family protein [Verrucomicrobiota bacterium]
MSTPDTSRPSAPQMAAPLIDIAASVLLAGGVITLLVLPSNLFPVVLRAVPLTYAIGLLGLRLASMRHRHVLCAAPPRLQEWLQLAALLGILLTLVPSPLAGTRVHGSTRFSQNQRVETALQEARNLQLVDDESGLGSGYAHTRNKAGTVRVLLSLLAMHAAYFVAVLIPARRREFQLWLLAFFGAAVAIAGVVSQRYAPQGQTLWWIFPTESESLPGPLACFINPNHYAGYLAMLSPCALALSFGAWRRRRLLTAMLASSLFVLMALGLSVSQSRGGLLAFTVGIAAVAACCLLRGRILAGLAIAALLAGMALNLPVLLSDTYRERLSALIDLKADDSYHTRMQAWADSKEIIRKYPLLGAGANGFRMVFPQVRSESTQARMTHVENEYVQLLTDFGIVGAVLFLTILACMLTRMGQRLFLRAREIDIANLAAVGSLAVIGAHAVVDFALHIPLYAVTAAIVLGLGHGAAMDGDAPRESHLGKGITIWTAALLLTLSAGVVLTWGRLQHLDSIGHIKRARYAKLSLALRWAPTSPQIWQRLGERGLREQELNARIFGEACLTQAGIYNPKDYTLWYDIGMARLSLGDRQGARQAQKHVQSLKDWYWKEDLEVY